MAPRGEEDIDMDMGGNPPSPPFSVEVTDWDATSVKLKWKAPENDGGIPITFFHMQFKAKTDEEWQEGIKIKSAKNPSGTVDKLETGVKYEFRVLAENRAGQSNPSESTPPMIVKAQKAPPRICRKSMEEKVVKTNQQLDLSVPVEGEPAPECWWERDGKDIVNGANIKASSGPGNIAKLLLIPAKRPHAGTYTLKSKNKWGEDSAEIEINIHGRPTIPNGPLKVNEVTKRSCLLQWRQPDDNGGKQIQQYEVEKMEESMGSYLPVGNTKGLSLNVKNLVEGKSYKFLVRAVNEDGDSPELETEDFIIAKNAFDKPSEPGKVKVNNWGPNWAELSWKPSEEDGGAEIERYKVEMRNVDRRAWNEIASTRECTITVENCGIELDSEYIFRVTAVNKGGESPESESSNPITAIERFVKPRLDKEMLGKEKELNFGQMLKFEAVVIAEPAVKFTWCFSDGEPILHDGDRIQIDNSTKNISVFMFKNIERKHSGGFKLNVKNSVGEDEHEIRLTVLAPPTKPSGKIHVSNVRPNSCSLSFEKPTDEGGSPLTGYLIERKDVEKDYWSVCGRISGKMVTVMKQVDYEVTDLMENFCYVFRVSATNAIGDSEPLLCPTPIVAKLALDPPAQPYNINVVDYDSKWVMLDWSIAPGPKADKFIVEKLETFMIPKDEEEEQPKKEQKEGEEVEEEERPKFVMPVAREPGLKRDQEYVEYSTGWMVAGMTDDESPELKITDVQEGYRYQFRVKAANKAGISYPSEQTDEIIAKKRKQKPVIDRCGISNEMQIERGSHLTLKCKVQGEPITDKSWFWGRREIKSSGSVIIEDTDYTSKLHIMCLERVDTGTFYFRAENLHGFSEMAVDVIVMVSPSKPKGPMRIDDICAEGCTAIWNKPEDDGGSPITHYVVEKVHGSGENFQPCGRVNASETECKIRGLTENKEYRLQVIAVNAMGESEPLVSIDGFVTENPFQNPGAPGKPEMFDWDLDHFDMKWEAPRNDGGSKITGYELEARLWRDMSWFRAGEVRMQFERGVVEGVELGSSYTVRVRARNAAGFGPWSIESDQLTCKFKNLPPKVTLAAEKEITVNEHETFTIFADIQGEPMPETITWSLNGSELNDNPKGGITIDNSKNYKSKLQLDAMTRKDCGTLTCEVSNMNGKAKTTTSLHVIGKPSVPLDRLVVSNINSSGCRLSWEASKDNGGLSIEYVVDRHDVQADAWVNQGVTRNNELTVNDLENGKEYGFRVHAMNDVGDSEALYTAKNILAKNQYSASLPPSAPEVVDGNERHMTIRWKAPIDDGGRPITGYHVEAKTMGSSEWQPWELLDLPETTANLTKLQKGFEYQFRVIAINKAGKSEPSHPSRPRVAKENDLLPFIEMKGVRDITASVKERIKFDVPICGEPVPDIAWFKGETPVEELEDRAITVTNTDTHTKIVFSSLKKCHEGNYSLTISNRSGVDNAKFSVKVLDRPAAPEPPMKATIEGSNCTLLWKKVKEDGGSAIEHYQIEKQDTEKGTWGACGHTKDNSYTIKGLFPGHSYQFRVCAVNQIGDSDFVTSEDVSITDSAGRGL